MKMDNQLRWRATRRGTRELDLLFARYLDAPSGYAQLTPPQQSAFAKLLQEKDPDIFQWLMATHTPEDAALCEIILHMRTVLQ